MRYAGRMKRYSVDERRWVIEELAKSGLSRAAFCQREGLCYSSVTRWAAEADEEKTGQDDAGVRLLEVGPVENPDNGGGRIEVFLSGGTRVCFAGALDMGELARFCREVD